MFNAFLFVKFFVILHLKKKLMKNFTIAKVIKKNEKITPFGGINFINDLFNTSGLCDLIDRSLGARVQYYGYSYGEIIRNFFNVLFCGGDCAEDINKYLKPTLASIPGNKVPSADTILRIFDELATENTVITSSNEKNYQFNINERLSKLLIDVLLLLDLLKRDETYDLDYDNQILAHEKWDAQKTYKKNSGYFPGVATIGSNIVYIENRDGNANVKLEQAQTLQRMFTLFDDKGISINRFRADAGSYSTDIIDVVSKNSNLFYIRANKCSELTSRIHEINDWKTVEINNKEYEVASIPFTSFFADRNYRLVVMRERRDGAPSLFPEEDYTYRCILTNDHDNSEIEVIEFYNQRGSSEKNFDVQNNDFGWRHLPCSDMNKNTVYLIVTAILKNFYNYIINKISVVFTELKPTSRLKRFIFTFITVTGKWIKQGRQLKLLLYTKQPYEKLLHT